MKVIQVCVVYPFFLVLVKEQSVAGKSPPGFVILWPGTSAIREDVLRCRREWWPNEKAESIWSSLILLLSVTGSIYI